MITIKHNGIEISCTDVDEAVELIKKLTNTTIIIPPGTTPNIPWPQNPITSPTITWDTQFDKIDDYTGINECKPNLPDDVDDTIAKINSVDRNTCPHCGGRLINDPIMLASNPPQYQARCEKCGKVFHSYHMIGEIDLPEVPDGM